MANRPLFVLVDSKNNRSTFMILFLCSYPRSGNSRFTTTIRTATDWKYNGEPITLNTVHIFTRELVDESLESYRDPEQIYFIKRHGMPIVAPLGIDTKSIYIIRDGRDALVSYAHMHAELDDSKTGNGYDWWLKYLTEGKFAKPFGNWADHVKLVSSVCDSVIRYEDMNEKTILEELKRIGITCKLGIIQTFDELATQWGNAFYRRGIIGSHKDEMPPELIEEFNERWGDTLRQFNYL